MNAFHKVSFKLSIRNAIELEDLKESLA